MKSDDFSVFGSLKSPCFLLIRSVLHSSIVKKFPMFKIDFKAYERNVIMTA